MLIDCILSFYFYKSYLFILYFVTTYISFSQIEISHNNMSTETIPIFRDNLKVIVGYMFDYKHSVLKFKTPYSKYIHVTNNGNSYIKGKQSK